MIKLKQLIKEELSNHFLHNSQTQKLNKIIFNLYDNNKTIDEKEFIIIKKIIKDIDKMIR